MAITRTSISEIGLQKVGLSIPEIEGEIMSIGSDPSHPKGAGETMSDSLQSLESSTSVSDGDEDNPPHPHHLKLLALSEVLMQSLAADQTGSRKDNELSSVVGRSDIGLLEEAKNRWWGRKERCVHWDKVEINGREFPLQRADTSSLIQLSGSSHGNTNTSSDLAAAGKPDTSYLLVGHSTCDMCLMNFETSSVSGVITMKRILEARRDWGLAGSKSKKYAAASSLYDSARLCALCSQFFCSRDANGRGEGEGGELAACGVGRSDEHVSLSLESMASNKPLPDKKTSAAAAAAKAAAGSRGRSRCHHQHRNGERGGGDSAATSSCGKSSRQEARSNRSDSIQSAEVVAANFRLDELIADDRFVVNETDLAKQPGAVASQSSTADGMGADVCMGFPAAGHPRGGGRRARSPPSGTAPRSPTTPPQRRKDFATQGSREPAGTSEENTLIDPSVGTTCGLASLDSGTGSNETSAATRKATTTAALVVRALSPAPSAPSPRKRPALPPQMREDERAAAAAAAARTCSRTRRENQPWWEVDLGGAFPVRCIRVHHPDRRTEASKAGASPFVDVSPFWIMTSAGAIGDATPEEARGLAISSKRVGSHGKVTVWSLGVNHFAAAVRVQAEGVKSLQLARVEVIKGGGTQQAKNAIQQQLLTRRADSSSCSVDDASLSSVAPQDPEPPTPTLTKHNTTTRGASNPKPSTTHDGHEHKMAKSSLLRFYQQDRGDGGGTTGAGASATAATTSDATALAAAPGKVSSVAVSTPSAPTASDTAGLMPQGTASTATSAGGAELGRKLLPAGGGSSEQSHRPQTRPAAGAAGGSCSSSTIANAEHGRERRRRRRGKGEALPGEDVRRLLLRAMVGYDWVDEFNSKDVRVRGAFTEQDVVVLEEIFLRCAFGDDTQARPTATVSDQSLRLDPGELCGDLRRLQLQVQTNPGGKGKTPMQLAIRESFHLFQLFSSCVVEALPDALARAEAQLPAAQRPLGLDWTRFLGVMGLCLEGAYKGTGLLAPSAVARLFEEKTDDRLEFLTRRRSRLPPRSFAQDTAAARNERNQRRGFPGAGVVAESHGIEGASGMTPRGVTGVAADASGSVAGGFSSVEDASVREAGSSIDAGDDGFLGSSADGGVGGSRGSTRQEGTPETTAGNAQDQDGGGGVDNGWGTGRRGRGGGAAALKSLLRPQARHEVFKGYGEAVSRRRERQREALGRAPEPDVEPTRAYKPCGLCQAPFPVESLVSTVSLKVLGTFLAMAGAPSERFERKASRLCALHRLPLCVYCSQFFDPDYPGGVVPPKGFTAIADSGGSGGGGSRRRRRGREANGDVSLSPSRCMPSSSPSVSSSESFKLSGQPPFSVAVEANGLVPFFDDRFPNRWSETPPPSSAPAVRAHSPPPRPSMLTQSGAFGASSSSCLSTTGHETGYCYTRATAAKGSGSGPGKGGADGGGSGGREHVCEATELREVGGLVRRGCSIRDRLAITP